MHAVCLPAAGSAVCLPAAGSAVCLPAAGSAVCLLAAGSAVFVQCYNLFHASVQELHSSVNVIKIINDCKNLMHTRILHNLVFKNCLQ